MRQFHIYAFVLIAISVMAIVSCGSKSGESSDIPVTTVSDEARDLFLQGRDAWEVGRSDEARGLFDQAIAADPTFVQAYLMRARTSTSPQDWKRHADLAIANRDKASPGEQALVDMFAAMMDDDAKKEIALATQLVADFPKSARAHFALAEVYEGLDRTDDARASMAKAASLDASWVVPHYRLANSFIFGEPRDLVKAEEHASRYVELKPNEAEPHILLGDVYRAGVDLQKARKAYAKAARVDPTNATALSKKGHAETFLGNYDAARADFEAAAQKALTWKIGPKNFVTFTWLYAGDAAAAQVGNQKLIDDIASITSDPEQQKQDLSILYRIRCRMAVESGDFAAASDAYAKHAELERAMAAALERDVIVKSTESRLAALEGTIAVSKGDFEAAEALVEKAEEQASGLSSPNALDDVYVLRGLISLRRGNAEAALMHFSAASPEMIEVKYYSALANESLGRQDEAARLFKQVAEWNFNDIEYALVRSKAIAKLNP
jgi:tetratricopeptide (TPR) repeat protein